MIPGRSHPQIIQTLLEEHLVIQQALAVLRVLTSRIVGRRPVPLRDLTGLVRFFQRYADNIHHRTEEDILFIAVERNRILRNMNQKLLSQHTMGRIFVGAMAESLTGVRAGRRGWRKNFVDNASAYYTLLHIHICDENHVYFPRAERALARRQGKLTELEVFNCEKGRLEVQIARLCRRYMIVATGELMCEGQRYKNGSKR